MIGELAEMDDDVEEVPEVAFTSVESQLDVYHQQGDQDGAMPACN